MELATLAKELGFSAYTVLAIGSLYALFSLVKNYVDGSAGFFWPSEIRRRQRINNLLQYKDVPMDSSTQKVVGEALSRNIFWEETRIDAGQNLREDLTHFIEVTGGRYSWKEIRDSLIYLNTKDGRLTKGKSRMWLAFMTAFFFLALVAAYVSIHTLLSILPTASLPVAIAQVCLAIFYYLCAKWSAKPAWDILRARRMQKWLPDPHVPQPVPATPASQPSTISTAPADNSK